MSSIIPPSTKTCTQCQETKVFAEFYRRTNGELFAECKSCNIARTRRNRHQLKAKKKAMLEAGMQIPLVDVPQSLACSRCRQTKPINEFRKNIDARIGYERICKLCYALSSTKHRKTNRPYIPHPNVHRYNSSNPNRSSHLFLTYGLTLEQYEEMVKSQGNACAACGSKEQKNGNLCVDHCHKTGRVRGLLCHRCNKALGFLDDDAEKIERLAHYIRQYPVE